MSFDTLTIVGIVASILSGGFLIALASRNDSNLRYGQPIIHEGEGIESAS